MLAAIFFPQASASSKLLSKMYTLVLIAYVRYQKGVKHNTNVSCGSNANSQTQAISRHNKRIAVQIMIIIINKNMASHKYIHLNTKCAAKREAVSKCNSSLETLWTKPLTNRLPDSYYWAPESLWCLNRMWLSDTGLELSSTSLNYPVRVQ